jgi:DnaK suppressor protein
MPKAKQQDPVEAQEAEAAVHPQANGASRKPKGPALATKGAEGSASKPAEKAGSKAVSSPAKAATSAAVAKRAPAKEANGAAPSTPKGEVAPEREVSPERAVASHDHAKHHAAKTDSAKADSAKAVPVKVEDTQVVDAKPDKASAAAKAVRAHKPSGPEGRAGQHEVDADDDEPRDVFLNHQRVLLAAERNNYTRQAEELRAQAEALALEHEPGDVQFDEEGGEGGTANVDRELDLHLSAQAHAAIEEIDAALEKIAQGTYGFCESCGNPVPKARLEALPHARLCVSCKSGGLSARRQ